MCRSQYIGQSHSHPKQWSIIRTCQYSDRLGVIFPESPSVPHLGCQKLKTSQNLFFSKFPRWFYRGSKRFYHLAQSIISTTGHCERCVVQEANLQARVGSHKTITPGTNQFRKSIDRKNLFHFSEKTNEAFLKRKVRNIRLAFTFFSQEQKCRFPRKGAKWIEVSVQMIALAFEKLGERQQSI